MNFITSRKEALDILENYIEKDILIYSAQRNFDFGPQNRKNISCLSPYITHRLISEYEVVKKVLSKHPYQKVEKRAQTFFQDILECSTIVIKNKKINKQPSSTFIVQSEKQPLVCYLKCNITAEEPKNSNEDIKINITDISGNFIVMSNNALELLKYTNLVESFLGILREYKLLKDKEELTTSEK